MHARIYYLQYTRVPASKMSDEALWIRDRRYLQTAIMQRLTITTELDHAVNEKLTVLATRRLLLLYKVMVPCVEITHSTMVIGDYVYAKVLYGFAVK